MTRPPGGSRSGGMAVPLDYVFSMASICQVTTCIDCRINQERSNSKTLWDNVIVTRTANGDLGIVFRNLIDPDQEGLEIAKDLCGLWRHGQCARLLKSSL
jgi:hypothetical protein